MHPLIYQAWLLYEVLETEWRTAARLGRLRRFIRLTRLCERAWKRFERRDRKFGN